MTLDPLKFERFAQTEVGIVLADAQLKSLPQFEDPDICQAGEMLKDALVNRDTGYELMFESLGVSGQTDPKIRARGGGLRLLEKLYGPTLQACLELCRHSLRPIDPRRGPRSRVCFKSLSLCTAI